tara:strand:- start:5555 stop:6127 length:573 start_codon:yes stop_codon:yes gene_type:complete
MKNNRDWKSIQKTVNLAGKTPIICNKSQFKGNTVSMMTQNDILDKNIFIHNKYYAGDVGQVYDIRNDRTTIRYGTYTGSPKWLREKLHAIDNDYGFEIHVNAGDLTIAFGYHMYTSHLKLRKKGLALEGNLGSLDMLKEIAYKIREARNIIKHIDTATLVRVSKKDSKTNYMTIGMLTLNKYKNKVVLSE